MVQQRQLFAEVKVRKGELQFCETPFTHYHLSPVPSTNKGQVHYSLLGEKKNILKKPRPSQWQLVRASRHQIPQETNRHYMELILEKNTKVIFGCIQYLCTPKLFGKGEERRYESKA